MSTRLQAAVIADDLTGANSTGALLRAAGLPALAVLDPEHLGQYLDRYAALSIDADTRGLRPAEAYARVRRLAELLTCAGVPLIGKRIDSTLRGSIGAEIDAVLEACGAQHMALIVAAVPALGRITAGGYLLVDGRPLHETAAADPWAAPASSLVAEVVAEQSRHAPQSLSLGELSMGEAAIEARLRDLQAGGTRIVVADATTDAHLDLLAAVAARLPIVPVDPGPFSAALARARFAAVKRPPVLAVIGSVTQQTHVQLTELLSIPGALLVALDAELLCGSGAAGEVARGVRSLLAADCAGPLIITTAHEREAVLDLPALQRETGLEPEQAARRIAGGLAEVVGRLLESGWRAGGLYTTGGAVTQAVARRLGATGFEVERAILPLAVLGRLLGGPSAGLPVVSKGGLVGDHRAAVTCIEALQLAARDSTG